MEEIKQDINNMIDHKERPEMPEHFVLPFLLTTEEIKEQTKQEGEDFIQTSLTLREEELRATGEIADKKNKGNIKSIVDPTPCLLVDDEIDFQDVNFLPSATDNTHKLPPAVQKQLDEIVIDATQPKIERDLYIDNDLDSFMFVDEPKNDNDSMVIDVKLKNEQIKLKVDSDDDDHETRKIHISPTEGYVDIEKSLNITVIEISSDSENEVSYIKTTPSHPRDRLRQLNNKEREVEVVVVGDNDDEDNNIDL